MTEKTEMYQVADFCFLRIPAYPLEALEELFALKVSQGNELNKALLHFFRNQSVRDALHSSTSTEFFKEFTKWVEGEREQKDNIKMHETLIKYLLRMTTRCIPFGMFTGFSVSEVSDNTAVVLKSVSDAETHLRLDMEYIQDIVYELKKDPDIKNAVTYWKNSSVYRIIDKYKYVEYTTDTYHRQYTYAAVSHEYYLEKILELASSGVTVTAAIKGLQEFDSEITKEEAAEYVDELINAQLLVSELEPNITGEDNLSRIISVLKSCMTGHKYLDVLEEINSLILSKNYTAEKAIKIKTLTEQIVGEKPYWSILQTDMEHATSESCIKKAVLDEILTNVEQLSLFAYGIDRPVLEDFKRKFRNRYDMQEIPMVEALDPEFGVGYGGVIDSNELLKNVHFEQAQSEAIPVKYDAINEFVNKKYLDCLQKGEKIIEIQDADLRVLREKGANKKLPASFFIHGSLIAESASDIDGHSFRFQMKNLSGPPSCLTIGRFCHTSTRLTEKVRGSARREESAKKDAVYAEIVHLTDARVGNVTIRPHLREYEIQYLGKSGLPPEKLIDITDIMVSVRNNEVILRSRRLGREIIPRLSNAHVFTESRLPIYKFLGEVQRGQGNDWLGWHWGNLQKEKFLPRIAYKNIILKTAKWLLEKTEFPLAAEKLNKGGLVTYMKSFAERFGIPRYVVFIEELDKEFLIDMDSEVSLSFLFRKLIREEKVLVEEYFKAGGHSWITDSEGRHYVNEMMIPVDVKDNGGKQPARQKDALSGRVQEERNFPVGSEWLYFKVYTGVQYAEDLLAHVLPGLLTELESNQLLTSWHFIRYNDPDFHLRIRFRTKKGSEDYLKVLAIVSREFGELQNQGYIHKLQIDTYNREVERYGSNTMEYAEKIFDTDSRGCLAFIEMAADYTEKDERWIFAMMGIDHLFEAFGYPLNEKQRVVESLEKYFYSSTGSSRTTQKQVNVKYKLHEKMIRAGMTGTNTGHLSPLLVKSLPVLEKRLDLLNSLSGPVADKIKQFKEVPQDDLLSSYIHMFINRLFKSNPNLCEFVIYTMLNRYYTSQLKQN